MDNNNPGQVTNFIQNFTNKIEQLNALNARLRERVTRDTAFYPDVTAKLQQINAMVQAIENKLKTAKNRISILIDNANVASGELLQATKEGQTLAQLIQQNFQQRQEHKEIITDLRAQMTDLTIRINTLTRDLDSCHESASHSDAELNNCRSELMNTKKQLENCTSQLALNELMLQDCERQKKNLQDDLTEAQTQLASGTEKQQELATEIQGHLRDIENKNRERDELQRQQTELQGERDVLDAANSDLQGRHTTLQGERAALDAAHGDLQDRFNALDEANKQLIREHGELRDQYTQVQEQNTLMRDQVDNLTRERDALQADHTALQGQHGALQADRADLQRQHAELQGRHDDIAAQNQALQEQINALTREHGELFANRNALQGQHEALQGQHEALQGQHEALQGEHANVNNDIQALRTQRDQLIAAIDNASRVIDETIAQITAILSTGENSADITRSLEELLNRLTIINTDNIGEFEVQPGLGPRPPGSPRPPSQGQGQPASSAFMERFRNRAPLSLSDIRPFIATQPTSQQPPANKPSAYVNASSLPSQNTSAPLNPLIQVRGKGLGRHFVARQNPTNPNVQNADTQNLFGNLNAETSRFNADNPMRSPPTTPRKGGRLGKTIKKTKKGKRSKKGKKTNKYIKQKAGFLYNKRIMHPFQKKITNRNRYIHNRSSSKFTRPVTSSANSITYKNRHRSKSRKSTVKSAY